MSENKSNAKSSKSNAKSSKSNASAVSSAPKKDTRTEEQKKIDALIPSSKAKDGSDNTKEQNRFVGELRELANEKDKEIRAAALQHAESMRKEQSERAGQSGFDFLGNKQGTKAYYVCAVLSETPQTMKEIQKALRIRFPKEDKAGAFRTTYYDISNRLHDLGLIGKTSDNRYFLLPSNKSKKSK